MRFLIVLFLFFIITTPLYAHEVYVLDNHEIEFAIAQKPINIVDVVVNHQNQFLLWFSLGSLLILGVFIFSISRKIENIFDKYLLKIKRWSPIIAQVTLGLSLLASAYYSSVFGVELPFDKVFDGSVGVMQLLIGLIGLSLLIGFYPRIAALLSLAIFIPVFVKYGIYTLNYFTYLGEGLTIFLFGTNYDILQRPHHKDWWHLNKVLALHLHKYKFLILRICFGISLIYAAIYAKYLHGALAIETVMKYHLTDFFHFDPLFIVLGALMTELFLGFCFLFGFEIRFASIFFLIFLILSLLFFKEAVWPHIILIGTALSVFAHGYDKYTITGRFFEREDNLEPVL